MFRDAQNNYAYVGGNPISFVDPLGLERFPGYCDALDYIEAAGSVDGALGLAQADRIARDWEARTPEGQRLRNAENYLAAYVAVDEGGSRWAGRVGGKGVRFIYPLTPVFLGSEMYLTPLSVECARDCQTFHWNLALSMTKVVSIVRLVPSAMNQEGGCQEYCVQIFIPENELPWKNVGNVVIGRSQYRWKPISSFIAIFPDIEVGSSELYKDFERRLDPYYLARYRIKKIVDDLLAGKLPFDKVVPEDFSEVSLAETPVFLEERQGS